jgi:ketosteroid isomerase-like protein
MKGAAVAGELEQAVRQIFTRFDQLDLDAINEMTATDAQGIDEISRQWMRTADEITAYISKLRPMLSDVHSELSDVREVVWGDAGIVTCWLDQSYTVDGKRAHVTAPTTFVFRREDGEWRIALLHSIPLPPDE